MCLLNSHVQITPVTIEIGVFIIYACMGDHVPYVRTAVYQLIGCTTYRTRRGLSFTNLNSCLTITACSIIFVMSSCSARAYYYTLLIASEAIQGPEALAHEEQKWLPTRGRTMQCSLHAILQHGCTRHHWGEWLWQSIVNASPWRSIRMCQLSLITQLKLMWLAVVSRVC